MLLLTEMWSGLSWSARLRMALALLAVLMLVLLPRLGLGRLCGELGDLRAECGLWRPARLRGVRQMVQAVARG